jgi:hypothetical protein
MEERLGWAGQGPSVRLSVLQGRVGGKAGSVCPSICLSCRAGQGARQAGQGPNEE